MGSSARIELAIKSLLNQERFYAEFLQGMKRMENPGLPAVAGVGFSRDDRRIRLMFNSKEIENKKVTDTELTAIMKHEALHILMYHLSRVDFMNLSQQDMGRYNIAMDVAINQYISGLPSWTCSLEWLREHTGNPDIKEKQPFEYYLQFLPEQGGGGGGGGGDGEDGGGGQSPDDHSEFGGDGESEEAMREAINEAVREAAKRTEEACGAGNLPGEVVEVIKAMRSLRSWKKEIRRFTARALSIFQEETRMRRNRRQRQGAPLKAGNRLKNTQKIVFAIDTSGSMSASLLAQVAGELARVQEESKAEIIVIQCDHEITSVEPFDRKKVEALECKGRGGTRVAPVFAYVKEHYPDVDGLIYATDGELYEEDPGKPGYATLWMLPDMKHNIPFEWGSKAYIKE